MVMAVRVCALVWSVRGEGDLVVVKLKGGEKNRNIVTLSRERLGQTGEKLTS